MIKTAFFWRWVCAILAGMQVAGWAPMNPEAPWLVVGLVRFLVTAVVAFVLMDAINE